MRYFEVQYMVHHQFTTSPSLGRRRAALAALGRGPAAMIIVFAAARARSN
jgi:hypothetical protein